MMRQPRNLFIFAVLGGIVGLILGWLIGRSAVPSVNVEQAETDIRSVLNAQVDAWNTGDIDAYMASYLNSDDLRFASGGTVETGWVPTRDRYQRRYPDVATMGQLSTEDYEVKVIDADDAFVFGRWALEREGDAPGGLYTLHLKKIDEAWVIVSDHTSSN